MIPYHENKYGFTYGAATVSRLLSDEKKGYVVLGLNTPKTDKVNKYKGFELYVTKTGKVRMFGPDGKEWGPK